MNSYLSNVRTKLRQDIRAFWARKATHGETPELKEVAELFLLNHDNDLNVINEEVPPNSRGYPDFIKYWRPRVERALAKKTPKKSTPKKD